MDFATMVLYSSFESWLSDQPPKPELQFEWNPDHQAPTPPGPEHMRRLDAWIDDLVKVRLWPQRFEPYTPKTASPRFIGADGMPVPTPSCVGADGMPYTPLSPYSWVGSPQSPQYYEQVLGADGMPYTPFSPYSGVGSPQYTPGTPASPGQLLPSPQYPQYNPASPVYSPQYTPDMPASPEHVPASPLYGERLLHAVHGESQLSRAKPVVRSCEFGV